MTKTAKRFFSMLLALSLVFGLFVVPAAATEVEETTEPVVSVDETAPAAETEIAEEETEAPVEEAEESVNVEENEITVTLNMDNIDLSYNAATLWADEDVEIDENDPAIITLTEELKNIKVLNEDGESVALTESQIQTVLYMYQQYSTHWAANADVLGVQTPFFLSYNDNEDSLGILGEMLALANWTVDDFRNGTRTYDELTGMISIFLYTNTLGVEFFGEDIRAARDEVLALIEESGAQTDVQEYLILNDWIAHNVTFDMPYIMNNGKAEDEKPMIAEEPVEDPYYDQIYNIIYPEAESQLTTTFENQIKDGLKGQYMINYYKEAIWNVVYNGAIAQGAAAEDAVAQADQYISANAAAIEENPVGFVNSQEIFQTEIPVTDEDGNAVLDEETGEAITMTVADQLHAGWESFWAEAEEKGIPGMVDMLKLTYYQVAIEQVVYELAVAQGATEEEAETQAAEYVNTNANAIAADPVAFVDSQEMFQMAVPVTDENGDPIVDADGNVVTMTLAAQLHLGCDAFLSDLGIDGSSETNPDGRVDIAIIVAMQMDTPMDDLGGMTPNEAIPVFAIQMATEYTAGVLNFWQGSQFGAIGRGSAVCLGYTKTFAYLAQFLHPEIYGVDGAETDLTVAENWKAAADLYYAEDGTTLDTTREYIVDAIRITFDASVTMFGETEDNFNSDHFWNAVQVDGQWYYIDPCYTDVYTEVMMRDRVETDGSMNHMYFMFSHTTAASLYEGNYSDIKTLYGTGTGVGTDTAASASPADATDYEDSWISRIKSNTYFDGGYAYYIYDSTDLITMMEDYENDNLDADAMENGVIKLVRHLLDGTDAGTNGDTDYETLIEFNYQVDEDSDPVGRIYDPAQDVMVENELLTKLYAQFEEEEGIYPSIYITAAFYNGKVYFNLSNCILSYDVETGALVLVKEYNTVHGLRDKTNPFGGMAFSVVDSADEADFTVENHPIAGMTIKEDGNMYVSIATNFAFISGKESQVDHNSYGYEFEESNYNQNYSTYGTEDNEDMYESFGYTKETNDNDEFMWSANFVETLSMSHLDGTSHTYEAVTVEATCGRNGYTENRCTTCGAIEDGTRVEDEDSAHDHHYIYFEETFYTKADNGNWNTGFCYVCTECNFSITEPVEPEENTMGEQFGISYEEQMAAYEKEKAIYDHAVEIAGHVYAPTDATWTSDASAVTFSELTCASACPDRAAALDCLLKDNTISVTLSSAYTANAAVADYEGTFTNGMTAVYVASGEVEGYTYVASNTLETDSAVIRIYGSNRYTTSMAIADALKEEMGVEKFESVIVASGIDFPDALSASYLASVKSAPILLVNNESANINAVRAYINENVAAGSTVYLLGGTKAMPEAMEAGLDDFKVVRLSGDTRFETNLAILEEAGVKDQDIIIASAYSYADCLSASAADMPILLVHGSLTDAQKEFLETVKGNNFYIVGGTSAVSEALAAEISDYGTTKRLGGKNRFETSVLVAEEFFEEPETAIVAYAWNFPDGLCGGPLALHLNAPLILTASGDEAVAAAYAEENEILQGIVLGGSGLVADATVRTIYGMDSDVLVVVK